MAVLPRSYFATHEHTLRTAYLVCEQLAPALSAVQASGKNCSVLWTVNTFTCSLALSRQQHYTYRALFRQVLNEEIMYSTTCERAKKPVASFAVATKLQVRNAFDAACFLGPINSKADPAYSIVSHPAHCGRALSQADLYTDCRFGRFPQRRRE